MEYSIIQLATHIKIYESTLMRLCQAFGIDIYDYTVGFRMGNNAIVNQKLSKFVIDNSGFFKKYHDDYYRPKSPQLIAEILNRSEQEIIEYLIDMHPACFTDDGFIAGAESKLKYVSSFEIDFEIGTATDLNMNRLGMIVWHLGYKQKTIVDQLKLEEAFSSL